MQPSDGVPSRTPKYVQNSELHTKLQISMMNKQNPNRNKQVSK